MLHVQKSRESVDHDINYSKAGPKLRKGSVRCSEEERREAENEKHDIKIVWPERERRSRGGDRIDTGMSHQRSVIMVVQHAFARDLTSFSSWIRQAVAPL